MTDEAGNAAPTEGTPKAPRNGFTDVFLKGLRPLSAGVSVPRIADRGCRGLYLARKGASKAWLVRYVSPVTGKRTHIGGGSYPAVSLKQAREFATKVAATVAKGEDPKAKRAAGKTFGEVARAWFRTKDRAAERTRVGIWQRVQAHLFPAFEKREIASITRREAADLLKALATPKARRGTQGAYGGPEVARRTRGIFGEILKYAADNGIVEDERALPSVDIFAAREVKHHEALPLADLPRFLESFARNEANGRFPTRVALALDVLLFQRSGEVNGMRVAELDLEGAAWNIPGARMKRGRDHCVPLSRPAVALLRAMLPYAREGLVFPGYGTKGALTTTATLKHLRALGFEGVTVHGFRALARTALAEPPFSFPADVLEAQLSHAKESAIVAAYDRGDRFEQRREVVEKWAEYLETLRPGWLPVSGV